VLTVTICNGRCPTTWTYIIRLESPDGLAYVLKTSEPGRKPAASVFAGNTLATEELLLQLLLTRLPPDVPIPKVLEISSSLDIVPFEYLLLSYPSPSSPTSVAKRICAPLSHLRAKGRLSERQNMLVDLRLGTHLKTLHGIDNDFFGLPDTPGNEQLYSWQEAFTLMLEETLMELEAHGEEAGVDFESVRKSLSRAIGFYLFDDCEWPVFLWFAGGEESVILEFAEDDVEEEPKIIGMLAYGVENAVWGDPLMERMLEDPSEALVEGYGGSPIVFPRQKTKRMWYSLLEAMMALVQGVGTEEDIARARKVIGDYVEKLKNAPCY
jgi:hypothetical protein